MTTLYDHIQQLQSELGNSVSRRERAAIAAELKKAVAEQTVLDREFDQALDALIGEVH